MFREVHQTQHPITAREVYFSSKYLLMPPHTSQLKTTFRSSLVIHKTRESETYQRVWFRETMLSSGLSFKPSITSDDCETGFSPHARNASCFQKKMIIVIKGSLVMAVQLKWPRFGDSPGSVRSLWGQARRDPPAPARAAVAGLCLFSCSPV